MFNKISPNSTKLWRIRYTLIAIIASFFLGVMYVFTQKIVIITAVICCLVYIFFVLFYVPMAYFRYQYKISKQDIIIKKGVIFSFQITMPISRIKYVELIQSPAQRFLNLSTLVFHAAGCRVFLQQLECKSAIDIKNSICRGLKDEI